MDHNVPVLSAWKIAEKIDGDLIWHLKQYRRQMHVKPASV